MIQITAIVTWRSDAAADEAHAGPLMNIMDRWQALAPGDARSIVTRCTDGRSIFSATFPTADGTEHNDQRIRFQKVVRSILRDYIDDDGLDILAGDVVDDRRGAMPAGDQDITIPPTS